MLSTLPDLYAVMLLVLATSLPLYDHNLNSLDVLKRNGGIRSIKNWLNIPRGVPKYSRVARKRASL